MVVKGVVFQHTCRSHVSNEARRCPKPEKDIKARLNVYEGAFIWLIFEGCIDVFLAVFDFAQSLALKE